MLKVIIDTNVFVSSLIQHNYPFLVVDYIFKELELAETCNADYLITGNTKHFPMKEYKKTKIVSPKEFCELEVI